MKKRKKRKKRTQVLFLKMLLALVCIFIVTLSIVLWNILQSAKVAKPESETEAVTESQTAETEEAETEETETEKPETTVYPKPEYSFQTEEVVIEIPGLAREYTLAWVSDLHLITDRTAAEDVMPEFVDTVNQRYQEMFVAEDGMHSDELWPEIVDFLNYEKLDGIIFGGDIMDYCSQSNLEFFQREYERLNPDVPILYIRADHDYGYWYGGEVLTEPMAHEMHKEIDGDFLGDKHLDFDEFLVVGVNNSVKDVRAEQEEILDELYQSGKPVIAVTHVPYESGVDDSLENLSMEVRGKVYYWTFYSREGHYVPNADTGAFLERIYAADTPVQKVLAGHLHAPWEGMLTEQLSQHIFSPAYSGVIGIIQIKPQEQSKQNQE